MAAYRLVDDLTVICRLTACTPGSAPGPTLGIEYGKPLPLPFTLLPSVDSIRGFAHAAGFAAARRCLRFLAILSFV